MLKSLNKLKREIARGLSYVGLQTVKTNYHGLDLTVPMLRGVGRKLIVPDDPWMSRCLRQQLALKPGAVIDIGANAGIYLVKLRAIDSERQYIGFEPNPLCKYYVSEVIRLNNFKKASCFPFALSNKDEVRILYATKADDAGASLIEEFKTEEDLSYSTEVVTVVGDQFLKLLALPDGVSTIKIDVEGTELEVLEGLRETIKKFKPTFYCEIWAPEDDSSAAYQQRMTRLEALFKLLDEYDYVIYGASQDGALNEIRNIDAIDGRFRAEYMLVHKGDAAAMLKAFETEKGTPVDTPL